MRTTGRMITVAEPACGAMPSRTPERAEGNVNTVPIWSLLLLFHGEPASANIVRHGSHYGGGLVNGPLTLRYAGTRGEEVCRVWLFGRSLRAAAPTGCHSGARRRREPGPGMTVEKISRQPASARPDRAGGGRRGPRSRRSTRRDRTASRGRGTPRRRAPARAR